jgi:hypothetical protein
LSQKQQKSLKKQKTKFNRIFSKIESFGPKITPK